MVNERTDAGANGLVDSSAFSGDNTGPGSVKTAPPTEAPELVGPEPGPETSGADASSSVGAPWFGRRWFERQWSGRPWFKQRWAQMHAEYAHGEQRPLGGYVVLLGTYVSATGVGVLLARRRGRIPDGIDAQDLALLTIATYKLSRLTAKDSVTAVVRAPFTSYDEAAGEGEVNESVRSGGNGLRHAVGELLTCPFCLAVWIATALAIGMTLAPRATRIAAAIMTMVTGSDFLQIAYSKAMSSVS